MALQARKLIPYALAGWLPGGRRYCVLCEHKVWRFMPYRRGVRSVSPLMRALDVVGSDVEHFECPRCGSHDRERHLALYMRAVGMFDRLSGARPAFCARASPAAADRGDIPRRARVLRPLPE